MQDHSGTFTCNAHNSSPLHPCPASQILGMISDGVAGTAKGSGLAGAITASNAGLESVEFAEAYYRAARFYNSGVIDGSGDLEKGSATHCYASDVANRLVGWVDSPTACELDS